MNKKKWLVIPAVIMAAIVGIVASMNTASIAKVDANTRLKSKLRKPDVVDLIFISKKGTNWNYVMRNQGSFMYDSPDADENGNNAGGEFPRGTNTTIVFAAGAWLATLKNGVPVASETMFATEFQPGAITNSGVGVDALTASDPLLPGNKVYYIDELSSEASTTDPNLSPDREDHLDYLNWPGTTITSGPNSGDPATYVSKDFGLSWAVFNDLDTTLSQEGSGISPYPGLGIQITVESIVLANRGDVGDGVFLKFTFDNKTNVDYASSYLGLWMDADVDDSGNDLVGSDSSRGLGYVYNADDSDSPSATGFDFFQGPVVSSNDVSAALAGKNAGNKKVKTIDNTTGLLGSRTLGGDSIWLGASTLNTWPNGQDPTNNTQRYSLLQGLSRTGGAIVGGVNGWAFPGDVVGGGTNTHTAPGDQRILHGVGPFTVKAGAKQEIWAGVVGAAVPDDGGNPNDHINAVAKLLTTDDLIQIVFGADLSSPTAPSVPNISVSALDRKVVVRWDNSSEYSYDDFGVKADISTSNPATPFTDNYRANDFEGYRVYRSLTGVSGSFSMLAQYDDNNGIKEVKEYYFDGKGRLSARVIDLGEDTGLRYSYTDDEVTNLNTYFYAVTAYDMQPYLAYENVDIVDAVLGTVKFPFTAVKRSLETDPGSNVVGVTPMAATAGDAYNGSLSGFTHNGPSDGVVEVEVVDESQLTGDTYRIEMWTIPTSINGADVMGLAKEGLSGGELAYRVFNVTRNQYARFSNRIDNDSTWVDKFNNDSLDVDNNGNIVLDSLFDERTYSTAVAAAGHPDEEEFGIVDGVLIKVTDASGWKSAGYVYGSHRTGLGKTTRWWSGPGGLHEFGGVIEFTEEFWGVGGVDVPDRRDFNIVMSRDPSGWQVIYKHGTGSTAASNDTTLAPFSVFEVDQTDGNTAPRQIEVNFRDRDTFDAWTLDGVNTTTGGVGRFNYTYFDTNSYSGGTRALGFFSAPYNRVSYGVMWMGYRGDLISAAPDADAVALNGLYVTARGAGSDGGTAITAAERHNIFSNWVDNGTFEFRVNHVLTPDDQYTYNTTANKKATTSSAKKKGMDGILVVPNPFYGRSTYQASLFDKRIKFTGLPGACTIRIFTVAGDLVRTIRHNAGSTNDRMNTNPLDLNYTPNSAATSTETWNLQNEVGDYVASGMYIALVEAPGFGKKTVKFAVIQEKFTINGPDIR